jgi:hypothetical protein
MIPARIADVEKQAIVPAFRGTNGRLCLGGSQ